MMLLACAKCHKLATLLTTIEQQQFIRSITSYEGLRHVPPKTAQYYR